MKEALDLHPATYGGAQKGAKRVTEEMRGEKDVPKDGTRTRQRRDKRYRREKETIQKWFEVYGEQLKSSKLEPILENLEKIIQTQN